MIVIDLEGNKSLWSLTGHIESCIMSNKSSYHNQAKELIKLTYPTLQVLEEVTIHPRRGETLYLDFYLPLKKMCIEVHGEQHYKFVSHYYSSKLDFVRAKKRDKDKEEWCSINGIKYIELSHFESIEEWKTKIQ